MIGKMIIEEDGETGKIWDEKIGIPNKEKSQT